MRVALLPPPRSGSRRCDDEAAGLVDVAEQLPVALAELDPPTMTVSTLDTSAHSTTAATGSMIGAMLIALASRITTSACLPGVSEPVRSSTPAT